MRTLPIALLALLVAPSLAQPQAKPTKTPAAPKKADPKDRTEAQAAIDARDTYADITKTFGFVPKFILAFPDVGISGAWDEMKALQLSPDTALAPKTKELIGLAVSAQIPCRYCVYFHTEASKANGASDEEQKEAVAMAAITRHWSTVLNGLQIDLGQFKAELAKVGKYVQNPTTKEEIQVTDAASAYKDIENTFGSVPTFMRRFPEVAIAPAWREFKAVQLSKTTELPIKEKELIGLAVASQIPCTYCIVFHTEIAKMNGATDEEIREAVAMSALTRHWSTVLNGSMVDEAQFKKDVDRILKKGKPEAAKSPRAATR